MAASRQRVEGDVREDEEDAEAQPDAVRRPRLDEARGQGGFPGEADQGAAAAGQAEVAAAEAVDEEAVEEIAGV